MINDVIIDEKPSLSHLIVKYKFRDASFANVYHALIKNFSIMFGCHSIIDTHISTQVFIRIT